LAVTTAAAHLRTTRVTLSRVLNGKAGISAAMAIRLSAALGTTPELCMNTQSQYDLWRARSRDGSRQCADFHMLHSQHDQS
jgi:addiction module HigA family antidote